MSLDERALSCKLSYRGYIRSVIVLASFHWADESLDVLRNVRIRNKAYP